VDTLLANWINSLRFIIIAMKQEAEGGGKGYERRARR
jgi:hypothetical protein